MKKVMEKIKSIYLSPATFWDEVKTEQTTESAVIKDYFVFIAALPALAGFIGALFIGENFFRSIVWAVLFFGCAVAGIFLFSKIIMFLGKSFDIKNDELNIFKLAAYTFTPILLAGVFFIIPVIYWLSIVGVYGFYFYWIGFQKIVICTEEEKFNFFFISLIVLIILTMLIYLLPAVISGAAVYF
ncbi:YIP1 family protein [candidate division KSB1 bacterium]|nr:YIP1 family protein [candidate division KSB1 bacterium]